MGMNEIRNPKIYRWTEGTIRHGLNCVADFLVSHRNRASDCQMQIQSRDKVRHVADFRTQSVYFVSGQQLGQVDVYKRDGLPRLVMR